MVKTTLIEYRRVENLTLMSFDLFCSKRRAYGCESQR